MWEKNIFIFVRKNRIYKRLFFNQGNAYFRFAGKMWLEPESNRRHKDFQSSALPTELSSHSNKK